MHKAGYLGYVHSFRGFAILNVVAVHALGMSVLVVHLMRSLLGRHSRVLIGS